MRRSLRVLLSVTKWLALLVLIPVIFFAGGAATGFLELRGTGRQYFSDVGKLVGPNAVDTAEYVELGGAQQWITVRSQDRKNPILLFLHGGPGGALADAAYSFERPWEDFFTVVQWDQRGAGRSARDNEKLLGTFTKEQLISDAIELIELLRHRYGQEKIVLVGQSWGSVLGTEIAARRPDLLYAYVGTGQQVVYEQNFEETRRLLLDRAAETHNDAVAKQMTEIGPVPSAADPLPFMRWVFKVQDPMTQLGYSWHNYQGPGTSWGGRFIAMLLLSPALSDRELVQEFLHPPAIRGAQLELIKSAAGWKAPDHFAVPIILVQGAYDWQTPVTLARDYYKRLCAAPYKAWIELPNSAHVVTAEEPGRFLKVLIEDVLPATQHLVPNNSTVEATAACPS